MPYDDLAHKKRQREERIAAGLCARCGTVPPRTGRRTCEPCGVASASYTEGYRGRNAAAVKVADATLHRSRRDKFRARGLCVDCGSLPPRDGYVRCEPCGVKRREAGAKFRAADPARMRWYVRQSKYGITREQWEAMFTSQGGRCAICLTTDNRGRGWQTDHNHDTGEVRGILCEPCNKAIGLFREDPVALQRAARYVVIRGGKSTERQASLIEETAHAEKLSR